MSLNKFISELWSARLLVALMRSHVYGAAGVVNTDYQGEIKRMGDIVHIGSISDPTISDYTKNTALSDPQQLDSADTELKIDSAKSFHFMVDDVDAVQATLNVMPEAMSRAAYRLKDGADTYIAARMAVGASNTLFDDTTAYVPTVTAGTGFNNVYDTLIDLQVKLDESDVPEEGRWVILPAWLMGMLEKDNRFVGYGTQENRATLQSGFMGNVSGMKVYKSNNVPNTAGAKYKVVAGHPMAFSFAEQMNQVEAYRSQRFFADAVRGLYLYGGKVIRPECLAVLTASKS